MNARGKLLIIGGAEDRIDKDKKESTENTNQPERFTILKALLPASHQDRYIEVITTASAEPEEMEIMYKETFHKIGYTNVGFLGIKDKSEAADEEICKRLKDAAAVFFTGGDQYMLSNIFSGTRSCEIIKERYQHDAGFIVAGTSAGAMAMSHTMICGGGLGETDLNAELRTASGLGLLQNCIIDTHFVERGRFSRLAHAVTVNPTKLGIGLGEDTALMIQNGSAAVCLGSGMVVIIDGTAVDQPANDQHIIYEADGKNPAYVGNLKVHMLTENCMIDLHTHKLKTQFATAQ